MSMSTFLSALLHIGGVLLLLCLVRGVRRHAMSRTRPCWFPEELRYASLAYAEQTFTLDSPIKLIARVDRVYRHKGRLTLMEYKIRRVERVFMSDVIELSVQKMILELANGAKVNNYGFVVVERPDKSGRKAIKVFLLGIDQIKALYLRRLRILSDASSACFSESASHCHHCEYIQECENLK
ncbi:PD-(D/E)XK nuclease family protein [Janthinobacterium rivuli]|uniref:PD-(D/E)XK nuclease family protein n=1 Tax=Janthinobacterium sp. FT68W TaxID=2654255 RepID=UPI001D004C18|nr:PD-(D/E)XK nuclease family protein [Janthinobacterium sp. FT68W]